MHARIAAGKPVYCEKPLAVSLQQTNAMHLAAKAAGVVTRVGYNYQHNPIVAVAPPDHPLCHMGPLRLQDLEPIRIQKIERRAFAAIVPPL